MKDFLASLETEFTSHEDPKNALGQKAYLRNQFEHFGLRTNVRREIQKPFLNKEYLPTKPELEKIIKTLWKKPHREYHYFAQELAFKYVKNIDEDDIQLYEFMVTHNSWWDTVDFIATKLMGAYFKKFPDLRKTYIDKWLQSNNIWLHRSALLFQLKYKENLDSELMSTTINALLGSKEFFINKAIGWVLREYSRTNPDWVVDFASKTNLNNLSKKEALRLI